ncbi:MAG TPA: hypothetical protein DEF47_14410 [Herpetosiphon sp.]|uniref:non-specific serine/threonine protein kinase n=1 Tax=Herpetosiphon aurantiacus (strain ATCC 23779 / DSM 785 / 114-95) TaxID=316274 RepID=A9AZV8_HERA2|nr:protein kinase [Herpetosiphon sp.]ABX07162.1 serine/threonine protein kinase [Herpetosiphon aurantiacus DSM 785]HBW51083.1 hypothetical protein [Herpetosiphon sp.]
MRERYRFVEQLGKGGFATVWLAYDQQIGGLCAVKQSIAAESEVVEMLEAEATILAGLAHPSLPRIRDHFVHEGRACVVMDYIEGVDLSVLLATEHDGIAPKRVVEWAQQLCTAVQYIHTLPQPVLHRDIKPSNIKLTPDGRLVLIDFGIARDLKVSSLGLRRAVTAGYSPPEQYRGQTDARSDIYALTATIYALLTGRAPLAAPARLIGESLPAPSALRPSLPSALDQPLLRGLAIEPEARQQSAGQLALELMTAWRSVQPASPKLPNIRTKPLIQARTWRHWLGLGLVGSLSLGGFSATIWSLLNQQNAAEASPNWQTYFPALLNNSATSAPLLTPTPAPTSTPAPTATPAPTSTIQPLIAGLTGYFFVGMREEDGDYQIYRIPAMGGEPQQLTTLGSNYGGVVSPDGRQIAFTSERDGREQVYVMKVDGSDQRRVTNDPGRCEYPSWSPDGKQLAYAHRRLDDLKENSSTIYIQALDQTEGQQLTKMWGTMPTWGQQGIVFTSRDIVENIEQLGLAIIQPDGSGLKIINPTRDRDEHYAEWSPDGKSIAYVAGDSQRTITRQIWVMNADGSNPHPLTKGLGGVTQPRWSPDGKWIVFLAKWGMPDDLQNNRPRFNVWVVSTEGGPAKPFTISEANKFGLGWGPR